MTIQNEQALQRQLELEEEMRRFGVERFRKNYAAALKGGRLGDTEPGTAMIKGALVPVAKALAEWRAECSSGKAGRRNSAYKLLESLSDDVIAYISIKNAINSAIQCSNLTHAQTILGRALEDEVWCQNLVKADKWAYENVQKNLKRRRVTRRHNQREMLRAVARHKKIKAHSEWSNRQHLIVGALLMDMCITETGFFIVPVKKQGKKVQSILRFSEKTSQWIDNRKLQGELLRPLTLPMLVPPAPRNGDLTTGPYFAPMHRPQTIIKRLRNNHLKAVKAANLEQVTTALNHLDQTAWKVSKPVLDVITKLWRSGSSVGDLPAREDAPLPRRHKWMIEQDKKYKGDKKKIAKACKKLPAEQAKQLKDWRSAAARIKEANNMGRSKRVAIERMIDVATKFAAEKQFYFPHDLDFRGRIYDIPTGLHPQGADYSRGMLVFAQGKPVRNSESLRWLMIHGANTYGYDKVDFAGRVKWVEDNAKKIKDVVKDPYSNMWWAEADKPFCFLAWCFDYIGVVVEGKDSHMPIAMDGSCNGLQHFSAMLRDSVGGAAVNLVPSEKPSDIYQEVANVVTRKLKALVKEEGEDHWIAETWLQIGVSRKITKRPTMVMPYGGTMQSTMQYVDDSWHEQLGKKASPFGKDDRKACVYLGKLVHLAIREVVTKASEAMKWLQELARVVARAGHAVKWTTPSGFVAFQEYRNMKLTKVDTYLSGSVYKQIRVLEEAPGMNASEMATGISPNFVHSLDAAALILTVNAAAAEGVTHFAMIHDSYGTHAADTAQLAYTLREQFVGMYENHNVLQELLDEVKTYLPKSEWEKIPPLPEQGSLDIRQVLDSEFFFA